ncbi:phytanoyl-CoA dioxygenase PhyH [Streptomyces sp. Ag109_O5-1]|uniref:phytanoyl-CoA dioxygenase family protein n=1 Tax=Streptomyces sp. Ag109_O5-1 TaxID=1938851 RepID=UPI000FC37780|nr:phytanoyl-CoA dioxygenase family protein [Streptomyces sp. Ag109_O5-1]RPE38595.1 phytanoyl-CoA dioxygenase PhyH [Streptomyces sp. Ag109_O5-1]
MDHENSESALRSFPPAPLAAVRSVPTGTEAVDVDLNDVLAGQLVSLTGALQRLGIYDELLGCVLDLVELVASPRARAGVTADRVERLHEHLTVPQALDLRRRLATTLAGRSTVWTSRLLRSLREQSRPLYVCGRFYARIMMPEDVIAPYRATLVREAGFMTPHGPHLDSWFSQGTNTINLWMALGPVVPGNGMLFHPPQYRDGLRRRYEACEPWQFVGQPRSIALDPGDVLLFHGDHVHATEVNITDRTRFVVSTRITVGPPAYRREGTGWVPYHDLRLLHTPLHRISSLRSRLTRSAIRQAIRTVGLRPTARPAVASASQETDRS